MKFVVELNLEDGMVTEMTIFEDGNRCEFVSSADKPVDTRQAAQWVKEDLDFFVE